MDDVDTADNPVLLFDGVCNLCNGLVRFVIRHDPDAVFRFAPLQSDVAAALLADCDVDADRDTVVLVDGGDCYTRSTAALRVAARLGWPYRALAAFLAVPRRVRDAVYDVVAANRYDWFGRREECMAPTPDVAERFLVDPRTDGE
ncbi:thiol-disulfide oxidoreductase DCC family protein [Halomicrococcus gelatinilyticus]|uniref:thiol-disulfide oxidoreductase DCC family protein n=1 Tax=Halomicrococcus gelatinilyticus TaxID=1702103 RepID=UPI002E145411